MLDDSTIRNSIEVATLRKCLLLQQLRDDTSGRSGQRTSKGWQIASILSLSKLQMPNPDEVIEVAPGLRLLLFLVRPDQ